MFGIRSLRRTYHLLGLVAALGLLFLAVAATAQADGPQQVKLTADEYSFGPSSITVTAGQPVQLTIVNAGKVAHDLKSDIPVKDLSYQQADNDADEQQENAEKGVLDVDFGVGTTAQVTFTPTKTGTFSFNCDVPGHADAGMKGSFVVQAAAAAGQPAGLQVPASVAAPSWLPLIGAAALVVVLVGFGARLALRPRA